MITAHLFLLILMVYSTCYNLQIKITEIQLLKWTELSRNRIPEIYSEMELTMHGKTLGL